MITGFIYIWIYTFYVLISDSISDVKKFRVPTSLSIFLGAAGIIYFLMCSMTFHYDVFKFLLYFYYPVLTLLVCYILDKYNMLGAGDLKLLLAMSFVLSYLINPILMPLYILTLVVTMRPYGLLMARFKLFKIPFVPLMLLDFIIVSLIIF